MNKIIALPLLILGLAAAGCGAADTTEPQTGPEPSATSTQDIVDTAVADGSFKTLAAALEAADLVSTLKGAGPFTVFAPTDDAFAKLPAGTVEDLLKPENKAKLQAILTYHVAASRIGSEQVASLSSAKTVQGGELKISNNADGVMVNQAKVVKADIGCSNGVIHVIDSVLIPE